jgi:hypothetical protein
MKRRVHPSLRLVGIAMVATAGLLGLSSTAGAIDAPSALTSTPVSPGFAQNWAFNWTAPAADPGNTLTGFQGGVVANAGDTPVGAVSSGTSIPVAAAGTQFFRVRAVQQDDTTSDVTFSDYATLQILVDRTNPAFTSVILVGNPIGTWFGGIPPVGGQRTLKLRPDPCTDLESGLAAGACDDIPWTTDGTFTNHPVTVTDLAGNATTVNTNFKFDATKPKGAPFGQPTGTGTLVAAEPVFEWTPGADLMSGVDHYDVHFRTVAAGVDDPTLFIKIAEKADLGGVGNYTATRDPGIRPTPLPTNEALEWRIRTFDVAGNFKDSAWRDLTIDPTIPPAPSITGGPSAPTQDAAPTFTWQGTENTFRWDVTLVGSQNPARQGGGTATQTTLAALPDGDYTFRVTQITEAGQGSAEATRSFKVDTTPPAAPSIVARPTFPSLGIAPTFVWTTEPGAFSRWTVVNGAGVVVGPIDTPVTSAELPALAEGNYTFQVAQVDPAGNVSPTTTEGFTVIAPLVAPTPEQNARSAFLAALPKQNALRLQPKAGTTLPTLQPLLRWKKGPRGTKLYNLQIFKVTARRGTNKPKVTKVLSRFPRGLTFRAPAKNLSAGTCYVWRVWPYTGTAFTTRPVGVSNFCIAGSKVLRTKAAALRAKNRTKR